MTGTKICVLVAAAMLLQVGIAYGHGFGIDTKSASLGGSKVTITVEMPEDFIQQGSKQVTISATYDSTDEPVKNAIYTVGLFDGAELLFREDFFAPGGAFSIDASYDSGQVRIHGEQDASLGAWHAGLSEPLKVTGPVFGSGGLYTFEIMLRTLDMPEDVMQEPVYADLTLVDTVEFLRQDSLEQDVKFRLKSYFEEPSWFEYDYASRQLSFEMPFDWSEKRMSHVPVVHEEVHFPKDFAEFLYPSYVGRVNGIELFKASVVVDDYTEYDERIVHFVLLQDHLRSLKNQQKASAGALPDSMTFTLTASEEIKFPLTAFTRSEDFQVDLSWDPPEIEPGKKTNFIFTIRDGATAEPMRNSDYTFVILQNGQEIHRVSGQAQVGGDFESYEFAENQTGPTVVRFEDIRNSGQETEFGIMVVPEFGGIVMVALAASMAGAVLAGAKSRLFSGISPYH